MTLDTSIIVPLPSLLRRWCPPMIETQHFYFWFIFSFQCFFSLPGMICGNDTPLRRQFCKHFKENSIKVILNQIRYNFFLTHRHYYHDDWSPFKHQKSSFGGKMPFFAPFFFRILDCNILFLRFSWSVLVQYVSACSFLLFLKRAISLRLVILVIDNPLKGT